MILMLTSHDTPLDDDIMIEFDKIPQEWYDMNQKCDEINIFLQPMRNMEVERWNTTVEVSFHPFF